MHANDASPVHNGDAIRHREQFIETFGDEQDRRPGGAQVDEQAVHGRRGLDIQPAGRVHRQKYDRRGQDLATEEEALLVAAREVTDGDLQAGAVHVKGVDDRFGFLSGGGPVEDRAARNRRAVVVPQHRIFRHGECAHQTLSQPVFGNVGQTPDPAIPHGERGDVRRVE